MLCMYFLLVQNPLIFCMPTLKVYYENQYIDHTVYN